MLVVDDVPLLRELIRETLRSAGFEATEAASGTEALRLAREHPDLIVLDMHLPDLDGFEVCRRLKTHPDTAAIPILALSGQFTEDADRQHGRESGADAYLVRPVEAGELIATARALLRLRRAEADLFESERRRRTAQHLAGLGRLLAETLDAAGIGRRLADHARALFAARGVTLYRVDPNDGELRALATAGTPGPASLPPEAGASGLALRDGAPVATADVLADPRLAVPAALRAELARGDCRAVLAVPLRLGERPLGALVIADTPGRVYTPDETELARALADQAALALENARLYEAAERGRREADVVAELARRINACLDRDTVLRFVAEGARELCQADAATVALREGERVVCRHQAGPPPRGRRREPGTVLAAQVLETGRPARTHDALADPRLGPDDLALARAEGLRAALVAPITVEDRVEGLLAVHRCAPRPFSARDEAILAQLAAHAAIAIRNAALFARAQAARAAAEGAEQRVRDLVQGLDAIVWEADARTFRFTFVSRQAEAILGYPVEQWLGEPDFRVRHVHPEDRAAVAAAWEAAATQGRSAQVEYRALGAGGGVRWLRATIRVQAGPDGRAERLRGVMLDLTERRRAEQALARSEAHLRSLIEHGSDIITILDEDGTIRYESPSIQRVLGYAPSELIGRHALEFVHPDDRLRVLEAVARHRRQPGPAPALEFRFRHRDGRWRTLEAVGNNRLDDPAVAGVVISSRDVTDRKRAEALLAAEKQLLELIAQDAPLHLVLDLACRVLEGEWPEAACAILSADPVAPTRARVVAPHLPAGLVRGLAGAPRRGGAPGGRTAGGSRLAHRLGHLAARYGYRGCWTLPLGGPEPGRLGTLVVCTPTSRDPGPDERRLAERLGHLAGIALQRASAEAALRASEERFCGAFEHAGVGMALRSTDGRLLRVNRVLCAMVGYAETELVGRPYESLVHPEDRAADTAGARRLLAGEIPCSQAEMRYLHREGRVLWVLSTVSLLRGPDGQPTHFLVQAQDITERRELETHLRESQKLEAIGRLAGGIAHDFNNLLTVIMGRTQLLQQRLEPAHPARRHVDLVAQAAGRAAALTQQLLAFSRRQVARPRVLDPNAVVAGVEPILRRLIGEHIELVVQPGTDLGCVEADPAQLEQVIVNLAVNARDAMPSGGRLVIATARAELDAEAARRHPDARPGRFVVLSVSDTGTGMDAAVRARIFEPFFTTKRPGQGTGLGLATVYGIVRQSGGHIVVESEPGRGSVFRVYLPQAVGTPEAGEPPAEAVPVPRGCETVLLVEDDEALRSLAVEVLRSQGYAVLETGDPEDALRVAGAARGEIHLLLTDVVLPRMSGPELADALARQCPGLRVLYISGYAEASALGPEGLARGTLVGKPFTPEGLARAVRAALDTARREAGAVATGASDAACARTGH